MTDNKSDDPNPSEIDRHPWMKNVLSQRGGNYRTINSIELTEIASLTQRVAILSTKLRAAEKRLKDGEAKQLDVLGLEAFRETVQKLERHIGTLSDCVDQWEAHERHPTDEE